VRPALALLLPALAFAEPSIEARIDSQSATLDDTLTLQISIEAPQGYDRYEPPDLSDFVVLDTGRQTQTQIVMQGGRLQSRSTETFTYTVRARRTGDLRIGVARMHAGGRVYESRSIVVEVRPGTGGRQPLPPTQPGGHPQDPVQDDTDGSLFLQVSASLAEVWVGQQVNVTWSVYTQSDVVDYRPTKDPSTDAFWSEDLYTPKLRLEFKRQIVAGRLFLVAPVLRKALFPLREGDLTVGSMEAEMRTVDTRLFGSGPVVRRTPELTIRAKPLPAEGRPAGFSPANVGQFAIAARVDRTQVQAGEPIGLHVVVRGTGNIRGLEVPALKAPGFRVYEPKTEDRVEPGDTISGEKRIDYVLLPTEGGDVTIPSMALSYFDPVSGAYAVARTDPIPVTVIGDPSAVGARGPEGPEENLLSQELRPIRHRVDLRREESRRGTIERLFPVLLAAPPVGYLAVLGVGLLRTRGRRSTPTARRRHARRQVRMRLRLAEQHLRGGNAADFYAEAARSLHEALSERLGRRAEGMTREELASLLLARAGNELATKILEELDNCDFGRFAPAEQREGEMRACLGRLPDLLEGIARMR